MPNSDLIQRLTDKYPFLSICQYGGKEYIGIIMNRDKNILTMYDYSLVPTKELRKKFIELGETWWWESNRNIPINLFLKGEWDAFKGCKRTFTDKNIKILCGQYTSLMESSSKKRKRKSVILVRRVD